MTTIFHLAFKVKDLKSTKDFYHTLLGCKLGRETEHWVDIDFFGHQLSPHVSDNIPEIDYCGKVETLEVPIPHFGCILKTEDFNDIKQRLLNSNVEFVFKPQTRYKGQKGEQQTMFVLDYSNNSIEFKSFTHPEEVF